MNFPQDFLWGASTAAYQIEGGVREGGRGSSIWDVFSHTPGKVVGGDTGDIACGHYHHWREDIALMKELGLKAYRFSTAWPRLLPEGKGRIAPAGLDFYSRLIDGLIDAGIEPWLCLYHWDLPQALQDKGGWANRDTAGRFADYAELVARSFGDRVNRIATFNEPNVFTIFGYGLGIHAPGVSDPQAMLASQHHVNLAHGLGIQALRANMEGGSLGAVLNLAPIRRAGNRDEDEAARELVDAVWNRAHAEPMYLGVLSETLAPMLAPFMQPGDLKTIHQPLDWFGLNHYAPLYVRGDAQAPFGVAFADPPKGATLTGMGWPIDPDAFYDQLLEIKTRYNNPPLYVLENGYGGEENGLNDKARIDFLEHYLDAASHALQYGVDMKGYFVWSLLDNFEWAEGFRKRFGLVHVDYKTLKRTPKASFYWYQHLINGER